MDTDRIEIATPEGLTLHLTLAGLGSRSAAAIIDGLIIVATSVAVYMLFRNSDPPTPVQIALLVLPFALFFGYHIVFETVGRRQSPGKRLLGLRVVRTDGSPVGFVASLIRNLIRIVDFLPVAYVLGLSVMFSTVRNQRLGDLAAGAIVVTEPKIDRDGDGSWRAEETPIPVGWDVSAVTDKETDVIRQFLMRRDSLDQHARQRLAGNLKVRIASKVSRPPEGLTTEGLLETIVLIKDGQNRLR